MRRVVVVVVVWLGLLVVGVGSAWAGGGVSPWWGVVVGVHPSFLPSSGEGQLVVGVQNRGDGSAVGGVTPVRVLVGKLPAGLQAISIEGVAGQSPAADNPGPVVCPGEAEVQAGAAVVCSFAGALPPFEQIEVRVQVRVRGAASGEQVTASVSGGGAPGVSVSHKIMVGGKAPFGFEDWELTPEEPGGVLDTQAGSHPFQVTGTVTMNTQGPDSFGHPRTVALPRDIADELPVGFFGNPTPFVQCTDEQFEATVSLPHFVANACPAQSAIGMAMVTVNTPEATGGGQDTYTDPIFNMKPLPGEPARFAFKVGGIAAVFVDISVRAGGSYAISFGSSNITEISWLLGFRLTFWGVPGDPRHDGQRGWECLEGGAGCLASSALGPPFLVMPTSCEAPFQSTLTADSWSAPGHPSEEAHPETYTLNEGGAPVEIDGCNHLPFSPSISVAPDVPEASTSTGLTVGVHVAQTAALNPEGLADSTLRDTTVTLPDGVAVNPSGGDGLEGCTEGLAGFTGVEPGGVERDLFTPRLPGSINALAAGESEPLRPGINFCSNASKVATAKISTPLLPNPIEGAVYIATQNENPFGSLLAMYLLAEDPVSGTLIKVAGEVALNPATGQLVTTFKNTPELPFEELELHFFGGERAPLATPARCGPYETTATFTPWSGNAPANVASTFDITSGPHASGCPGASLPFSPALTGGSTNINAGAFTPLTTTISREDGQQNLQSVQLHMPEGLEGLLAGVKLCPETQANEGTCPQESLIGETTVSAGVGSDPVSVKGGKVYITEQYAGAPFGLSIVNPVKAGPFDLERDTANPAQDPPCDCVVVRAKIEVNPTTGALTITTDPEGPHAIPHLIDGIPVQIKKVNVTITRPGFTFNPTNCNPLALTGTIGSDEKPAGSDVNASFPVSVPFQVTNCAALKFQPKVSVTIGGHASKRYGQSVTFKISYPKGAMGTDAWVNNAKFDIPKQLPVELKAIQQACLAHTFETNRTACPTHSIIGHATVHTQVLPVPLEGPVYFVSYGGAKFPDVVMVLTGYGVKIELTGETFIDHQTGVTSATFPNTPDVPFETIEVNIPNGEYSEFGSNLPKESYDFCGQKLVMPTYLKAQNGQEIKQNTHIEVEGCPNTISISSHKVKGKTTTLSVYVPAAGKLTATGKGLSSVTKTYSGQEAQTFTLTQKKGGKLKTKIKLTFTPSKGKKQSKTITISFKK